MTMSNQAKLDAVNKKLQQLEAKKKQLEAREKQQRRALENHLKFNIGGALIWYLIDKGTVLTRDTLTKEEASYLADKFGTVIKQTLEVYRQRKQAESRGGN